MWWELKLSSQSLGGYVFIYRKYLCLQHDLCTPSPKICEKHLQLGHNFYLPVLVWEIIRSDKEPFSVHILYSQHFFAQMWKLSYFKRQYNPFNRHITD